LSIIDITDPNDSSIRGGLSNPDPILWTDVLAGALFSLTIDEFTSSEDVKTLFNLEPPPSFLGPYMVWGEIDLDNGAILLYLATSTGDRTDQFATLDDFMFAIDGSGGTPFGTGTLYRNNKLPSSIDWVLNR
jgi:hypothetical protein